MTTPNLNLSEHTSPGKLMKVKFPPCFCRKTEFPARQKCYISLSHIIEHCWAPFLSRAQNIFELKCKQIYHPCSHIQKMWEHSCSSLPIMAYCLPSMVLIKMMWVFKFTKKTKKIKPCEFFPSDLRFSFAEGKLWRRHYDAFLHRHLSKKSSFFYFQNISFWPESNT